MSSASNNTNGRGIAPPAFLCHCEARSDVAIRISKYKKTPHAEAWGVGKCTYAAWAAAFFAFLSIKYQGR